MLVVAAVLSRGGCILACRRRLDAGFGPGRWEFPGGKVRPGEEPAAALRRELREELGVEARIGAEIAHHVHRYPDGLLVELSFCRVGRYYGRLTNLAFAELRWCTPAELLELDFLEADRPLLRSLQSHLLG